MERRGGVLMIFPKLCYYLFGLNIPLYLQFIAIGLMCYKPIKKILNFELARILLIATPAILFFVKIMRNDPFFLSDDFAHLYLSAHYSYIDIFKMALASPGGIWVGHRIVPGFWLFKFIFDNFSTNIIPYEIVIFLLNFGNSLLFYFLLAKLLKNRNISALMAFVFGFSYISWISNIHELLALSFVLCMLISYFVWIKKFNVKTYIISVIFYILALLTKEITFLLFPVTILLSFAAGFDLKKNVKRLIPFLAIFLLYSLFYASRFLGYFGIAKGTGYSMSFSLPIIWQNLSGYLFQFFPNLPKAVLIPALFIGFAFFDFCYKKFRATPYLASYLLMIFPALLFSGRSASYYNYIPSVFLLAGFGVIIEKIIPKTKILLVVLIIFFGFGLFGLNTKLMENCFLIQYPWKSSRKEALLGLASKINSMAASGALKSGHEIKVSHEEVDQGDAADSETFKLFLDSGAAQNFNYSFDSNKDVVLIK